MHLPITRYITALTLFGALSFWAGIGYFAWKIAEAVEEHGSKIATMKAEEEGSAAALELHALARDTRDARVKLEELSDPDILEIYEMLENLSQYTGIPVHIASPTIAPTPTPPVRIATFIIEAQGTFAQVSHLLALLETFPIPSMVDEMQLGLLVREKSKAPNKWRLLAQINIFTTADIPSL